MTIEFPIDPAGQPRSSEDLRREIQGLFSSYHAVDLDFIIENVQNAFDALEEAFASGSGGTPRVEVVFEPEENRFTISDNGPGIADDVIRKIGTPSNSHKDPKGKRGHKGVGLVFAAWSTVRFRFATKRKGDSQTTAGEINGAFTWIASGSGTNPKVEAAADFTPDFLSGRESGTVFEFTLPASNKVRPLLRRLNREGLRTLFKMLTAVGFAQLPGTEVSTYPEWVSKLKISLRIDNVDMDIEPGFLFPHEKFSNSHDLAQSLSIDKADRIKGTKRCIYRVLDHESIRELFSKDDEDAHLCAIVEEQHVKGYGAFLDSSSTFKEWSKELYDKNAGPGRKRDLVQAGIHIVTSTMPCGETIPIRLEYGTGNANRAFVLVEFASAQPDEGRKTFQRDFVEIAQRISRHLVVQFVDNRKLLVPRSMPHGTTEAEHANALSGAIDAAKDKADLGVVGLGIVKEPRQEQEVVALFHALIASGKLSGYQILAVHGSSQKYDCVFAYSLEKRDQVLYPRDPFGLSALSFGPRQKIEFPASIMEFKAPLSGLVENFEDGSKQFDEIRLVVAWDKGDLKAFEQGSNYTLTEVDHETAEGQFHGETHVLRCTAAAKVIHVILLKDLISRLGA